MLNAEWKTPDRGVSVIVRLDAHQSAMGRNTALNASHSAFGLQHSAFAGLIIVP